MSQRARNEKEQSLEALRQEWEGKEGKEAKTEPVPMMQRLAGKQRSEQMGLGEGPDGDKGPRVKGSKVGDFFASF